MSREDPHRQAIVLDRDGTMVIDRHYLDDPQGLEFEPNAAEGLRRMYERGHRLVVITNQSGIGRGLFSVERLAAIHARLGAMVKEAGAQLAGIYYCPHTPEDGCSCRKPGSQLLLRAAADLGFDPAESVVIGDKMSDVEFGARLGAATVLIARDTGPGIQRTPQPDLVAADLLEVARWLEAAPKSQ
jgi:D-glycero-D-manno-heptose 1,7-bisphosphate phosphatase